MRLPVILKNVKTMLHFNIPSRLVIPTYKH